MIRLLLIARGPPERGASFRRAVNPPSRNRLRQRAAFSGVMLSSFAICLSWSPSAARSTIRARFTNRAGFDRAPGVLPQGASLFRVQSDGSRYTHQVVLYCKDDAKPILVTIPNALH
jgi:hypothetical protein